MGRGLLLSLFCFVLLIASISASSFGYDTENTDAIDSFGYDSRKAIVSEVSNITIINQNVTNINQTITSQIVINNSQESFINSSFPQNFNFTGNLTLGQQIIFTFAEIIDNIINGWIRITGNLNVTGEITISENLTVLGNNIGNATAVFSLQDLNKSLDANDYFNKTDIQQAYFNNTDYNSTDRGWLTFNRTKAGNNVTLHASV